MNRKDFDVKIILGGQSFKFVEGNSRSKDRPIDRFLVRTGVKGALDLARYYEHRSFCDFKPAEPALDPFADKVVAG